MSLTITWLCWWYFCIFQEVKAFALSLILFAYVSRQYCYRVRDEVVTEQFFVEEIYERELLITVQLEEEEEFPVLIKQVQTILYNDISISTDNG